LEKDLKEFIMESAIENVVAKIRYKNSKWFIWIKYFQYINYCEDVDFQIIQCFILIRFGNILD
jgi:hypothetical protein